MNHLNDVKRKESLFYKVRRGGVLIGTSNALKVLLAMVRTVVIARFLAPEDLGLMGIVLLSLAILESLSQTGFAAALIQKKKRVDTYLDTAWIVSLVRGVFLYCLLFFCAPLVASFFNAPSVTLLLRVVGLACIFEGLINIGVVTFRKELEFEKEFFYQQIEIFTDILLTISLAIILRSVWALVFGYLGGKGVKCFTSYLIHPYRPGFTFDREKARELFRFGRYLLGSSIIILLITQGDDAVVGKLLGTTALGFYVIAYKISNMPATSITHVFSQVAFPAYAKLQDDPERLRNAYLKALKYIAFVSLPTCGGLFVLAPELVNFFLGQKWIEIVPAMRVLCIFGVIRALGGTTGPLFQGVGRPDIITKLNLGKLLIIALLIIPLTQKYGIVGTAITVTIPMVLDQTISWHICARIIRGRVGEIFAVLVPSLIGTLLMIGFLGILKKTSLCPTESISTVYLIISGMTFYFLFFYLFYKREMIEISDVIFLKVRTKSVV